MGLADETAAEAADGSWSAASVEGVGLGPHRSRTPQSPVAGEQAVAVIATPLADSPAMVSRWPGSRPGPVMDSRPRCRPSRHLRGWLPGPNAREAACARRARGQAARRSGRCFYADPALRVPLRPASKPPMPRRALAARPDSSWLPTAYSPTRNGGIRISAGQEVTLSLAFPQHAL